ncbi:cache domain-containing protein [Pararhodobacter sp. CCB-MM2]|uniref:cache domain-containing protein n=1 Tax=Pararhodobacter sp. CCB-MM2 TaxID=1786003 RepID=UPI00083230F3|nr:cache domain-containing protein [Pararhodobacter sp. CCB-MM2]
MARARSSGPRLTLPWAVYAFVLISLLAMSAGGAFVVFTRSQGVIDDTLDSVVRVRTVAAAQLFARRLHDDWTDLHHLAETAGGLDRAPLQAMMDGLRGDGSRLSWIGFADVSGVVVDATEGMLEGADVSSRPWFTNGLRGGFGGDLHEAVLLANLLPNEGDEPLRFVDLATPVTNAEGDVVGVLGIHLNAEWVAQMLRETGAVLEMELFLLGPGGNVVMAPGDDRPDLSGLSVFGAARTGSVSSGREVWPDGQDYFTALVPDVGYRDLPGFGWRMAGRIEPSAFRPGFASLQRGAILAGGVALAILLVLTVIFVRLFMRPISHLAWQAGRIAEGEQIFPEEQALTLEAEQISGALARLQAGQSNRV